MGSRTTFEFSNEDKLLFRTMVSRATGLFVQTRLRLGERAAREEMETRTRADEPRHRAERGRHPPGGRAGACCGSSTPRPSDSTASRASRSPRPSGPTTLGLRSLEGRPLPLEEISPVPRPPGGDDLRRSLQGAASGRLGAHPQCHGLARAPPGWHPGRRGAHRARRDGAAGREAEQAETLALLDSLLATAPIGLSFVDRELRYVRINRMLADINGVPVEQSLGRTVREVLPEEADRLEPLLRQVFETGEPLRDAEVALALEGRRGPVPPLPGEHLPGAGHAGRGALGGLGGGGHHRAPAHRGAAAPGGGVPRALPGHRLARPAQPAQRHPPVGQRADALGGPGRAPPQGRAPHRHQRRAHGADDLASCWTSRGGGWAEASPSHPRP